MARLIVGNDAVFELMSSAPTTQQDQAFINSVTNTYQQAFGAIASSVNNAVQQFQQCWQQSDAARIVEALAHKVVAAFSQDKWQPLTDNWRIQNAPNPMLRGIMAIPEVRKLARKGMCCGYDGRYFDLAPDDEPEFHRDRLMARDGMFNINDDAKDDEPEWSFTCYDDTLLEDDPYANLTLGQKYLLEATEQSVLAMIAADIDPTDEYNGSLGRA